MFFFSFSRQVYFAVWCLIVRAYNTSYFTMRKSLIVLTLCSLVYLPIVLANKSLNVSNLSDIDPRSSETSENSLTTKLNRIETWLPTFAWPPINVLENYFPIISNASEACRSALDQFVVNTKLRTPSTLRLFGASGKFRPGLVSKAQQSDFGFFEQCPMASHRHYFVELDWPLPLSDQSETIKFSIKGTWLDRLADLFKVYYYEKQVLMVCLPNQCSTRDYQVIAQEYMMIQKLPLKLNFNYDNIGNDIITKANKLRFVCVLISIASLSMILISTLIRVLTQFSHPLITALDMVDNTRKLFRQSANQLNDRLSFLSGYRFIYGYVALVSHLNMTALVQSKYTQGELL